MGYVVAWYQLLIQWCGGKKSTDFSAKNNNNEIYSNDKYYGNNIGIKLAIWTY